jgi:RsiW-degrading membrane proteinase PrsW (M82 family)
MLARRAWVWLGLRVLLVQIIGFAALYAVVMSVQGEPVPWSFLIGASLAAACVLLVFTMVLRSQKSYVATSVDSSSGL